MPTVIRGLRGIRTHTASKASHSVARGLLDAGRNMLRITRIQYSAEGTHLRLEGRIVGDWVELLERELSDASVAPFALDLSRVEFVSEPAVPVLRAARQRGIELHGCSPLVLDLLNGAEA